MKKTIVLSCILFIVFLVSENVLSSGVSLTGIGAPATALGGNFRGIANDWSAMYWNPAGITQIKGFHFGGSLELIRPKAEFFPEKYTHPLLGANQLFSGFRYNWTSNEPRDFYIPSVGLVYGTDNMTFGLGVFVPFGLGAKWNLLNTVSYNPNYPRFEYDDDLKVIDIQPTFAYKLTDKLSVGIGLGLTLVDIKIIQPNFTPNPVMGLLKLAQALPGINPAFAPTAMFINAKLGGAFAASNFSSPYSHLLTQVSLNGDGQGFGLGFGIKYDLNDDLSVGLSGRYYLDVDLDGVLKKDTYFVHKNDGGLAYGTVAAVLDSIHRAVPQQVLAAAGVTAEAEAAMRAMYSGGLNPADPVGVSKFKDEKAKATLPLPMELGLGIAYKGFTNLLISADLSWVQWSSWDVIEIELSDGSTNELVENWEDGIRAGLGLQYTMNKLKVNAGFYTEPEAVPDMTLSPTIPDISRRISTSFGLGYDLGKFSIYGSYERLFYGDKTVSDWELNPDGTGYENLAGTYKMNVNILMFGLQYNF